MRRIYLGAQVYAQDTGAHTHPCPSGSGGTETVTTGEEVRQIEQYRVEKITRSQYFLTLP